MLLQINSTQCEAIDSELTELLKTVYNLNMNGEATSLVKIKVGGQALE